mgnify:CR=1 FL=1
MPAIDQEHPRAGQFWMLALPPKGWTSSRLQARHQAQIMEQSPDYPSGAEALFTNLQNLARDQKAPLIFPARP